MAIIKHLSIMRLGAVALMAAALTACGGGGGGGGGGNNPPPATNLAAAMAAASTPANNSANNPNALFPVLQGNGTPVFTVASPPKFNFGVLYSDGTPVTNLTLNGNSVIDPTTNTAITCNNISAAVAKLDPGTNSDPDQFVNYIYRTEAGTAGVGPGGVVQHPNAKQATTDAKTSSTLTFNDLGNGTGYWTYQFTTDIKAAVDPLDGTTLLFDTTKTHRAALQLCFQDKDGSIVRVNPYYDFTLVSDGTAAGWKSAALVDPATQTRIMVVKEACNTCHTKLALHGGGRVDPQYCVMCHNSRTQDANSGNILEFRTMVHKIHAGVRLFDTTSRPYGTILPPKFTGASVDYSIWGFNNVQTDFADVGFPQDLRNCTKCHNGTLNSDPALAVKEAPVTPQGDNWKTKISKQACLTCHKTDSTSPWVAKHSALVGSNPDAVANAACVSCHTDPAFNAAPSMVHFNQGEDNTGAYHVNLTSATVNMSTSPRTVTLNYSVTNPHDGTAYDLRVGCPAAAGTDAAAAAAVVCPTSGPTTARFSNLQFTIGTFKPVAPAGAAFKATTPQDYCCASGGTIMAGSATVPGFSGLMYKGVDDGAHNYTLVINLPDNTATAVLQGTARIFSQGTVKEIATNPAATTQTVDPNGLNVFNNYFVGTAAGTPVGCVATATAGLENCTPTGKLPVSVADTMVERALTGSLTPRRTIVADAKCDACHSILGTTSGSDTINAFHGGGRNSTVECPVCHDPYRASTLMTDPVANALGDLESAHFKRLIHGIHGGSKRVNAYVFAGEDWTAKVNFPGILSQCTICHEEGLPGVGSFERLDVVGQTLGSMIKKEDNAGNVIPSVNSAGTGGDPMLMSVISPTAAACSACHDSAGARSHMIDTGGAVFGNIPDATGGVPSKHTQVDLFNGNVTELCSGCHGDGSGGGLPGIRVKEVHNISTTTD